MNPAMREHAASDDHVVKCTKVSQHLAILQFVVKVLFCFFILVVCGCVALNDLELDVFFLSFF